MVKKKIMYIIGVPFLFFVVRELYGAADYIFNLTIARGDKLSLSKLIDLKNEEKVLQEDIDNEQRDINEWKLKIRNAECNIKSFDDLPLFGKIYLQQEHTDNWVVIAHGYGGDGDLMNYAAKKFFENGYNVVLPDLRSHGKSGGDYIGMGWKDRLDIIEWCRKIINGNENCKIILYGVSMGAATVLMAGGEKLPPNIRAIIADCSYESVTDVVAHQMQSVLKFPAHPFVDIVGIVCKLRAGYDFKEASVIKQVRKCKIPILFFHGDSDSFVPTEMVYKLYDNAKVEKDLLIIKGAGHGVSAMVGKNVYWNKVFQFVNNK